jgi:hypothetical protein
MLSNTSASCSETLQLNILKHFSSMLSKESADVFKHFSLMFSNTSVQFSQTIHRNILKHLIIIIIIIIIIILTAVGLSPRGSGHFT